MGQKADQNTFSSTNRPGSQAAAPPQAAPAEPPPLPPRNPSVTSPLEFDAPPAYAEAAPTYHSQPITESWSAQDPRSSSTQSLVPDERPSENNERRLLLIWIHGFMGNETSFQSFPAHVHNVLSQKLQTREEKTYVVHTKIYPRYKSRNKIVVARDAFSTWLAPHEDANTDIILLGHSLGGILSAEVVMQPALAGEHKQYRHRILGTVNFDTPFLGMHPGVISSGLGSIFRPASPSPSRTPTSIDPQAGKAQVDPEMLPSASEIPDGISQLTNNSLESSTLSTGTLSATTSTTTLRSSSLDLPIDDPNYDPPYANDVYNPQRSGRSNIWHFLNKHADGSTLVSKSRALTRAARGLVTSHLEFGGCLTDYYGLNMRYKHLKELERETGDKRVRFVNYYTASTGRPRRSRPVQVKEDGVQTGQMDGQGASAEDELRNMQLQSSEDDAVPLSPSLSMTADVDEQAATNDPSREGQGLGAGESSLDNDGAMSDREPLARLSPAPVEDTEEGPDSAIKAPTSAADALEPDRDLTVLESTQSDPSLAAGGVLPPQPSQPAIALPPIAALPNAPSPFDPALYTDKDTRKLAEKEHSRSVKNHERLVKDREKAIKDRRKLIEKREAAAKKDREKAMSAMEKEKAKAEADAQKKADKEKTKVAKKDQASAEKERLEEEKKRMEAEAQRLNGGTIDGAPLSQMKTEASIEEGEEDQNDGGADGKPKKDRKFCLLPSLVDGEVDPCWIRVFMPGVDEVGAHCGLFTVDGSRYEWFVGDVADRVEEWIGGARK